MCHSGRISNRVKAGARGAGRPPAALGGRERETGRRPSDGGGGRVKEAAAEEAGGGSRGGGGLGIGSGGASTGRGGLGCSHSRLATVLSGLCCRLLLLCSRSGCGEFATLSAPAWLPKEKNGGSEGDVAIFPGHLMSRSTVENDSYFI
jgi:hypothetical protein